MKKTRIHIIFIISLFIISISCKTTLLVPDEKYLLSSVKVKVKAETKSNISTSDIEDYIMQKPNRKTLLIFPFRLWVYNWSHYGKKSKWKETFFIYKLGNIIGEPPVIYNDYLTQKSVEQIKIFLRNNGYFNAVVDTFLHRKKKKISIEYLIKLNKYYKLKSIRYKILDPNLEKIVLNDTINSYLKVGKIFNTMLFEKERERIVYTLKKNGYFTFNKNYIEFIADTNDYQVDITTIIKNRDISKTNPMGIKPHIQFYIGKVVYYTNIDALKHLAMTDTLQINNVTFIKTKKNFVSPKTIVKGNYIYPGKLYNIDDVKATYNYLWKLNTYKIINIYFRQDSAQKDVLDCYVELTPMEKYSFSAEIEGTNTSGNLGAQGNLQFTNRSLLGRAENFTMNIKGAIQRQTVFSIQTQDQIINYLPFNTIETGGKVQLSIPHFWLPINSENFVKKYNPKTVIQATFNYQKRPDYENEILKGSFGYSWKFNKFLNSSFELLEINSVKVFNITQEFKDRINGTFLEYSFVDHIITATNYTIGFNTPLSRKNVFSVFGKVESSGNILSLINAERNFLPQNDMGQNLLFGLPYSQYMKFDLDFRYYYNIDATNQLAYRFFSGVAVPYGNMEILPFEKRYYAGGANGIRAWEIRTLGPGSFRDTISIYPNQSGDLKLLFSWEYRFHLFWLLNAAFFVDAGNIWSITPNDPRYNVHFYINNFYKQIAIGSGVGFRFDFTIFVFRLDFAMKVRDPALREGERWLPLVRKTSISSFNFNLGIGYPF